MLEQNVDQKKKVLGRGLDSLIPAARSVATPAPAVAPPQPGERVLEVPLDEILPNPYQTRSHPDPAGLEELAASIRAQGVLQPIVIRYIYNARPLADRELEGAAPRSAGTGTRALYYIIAGERRWQASRLAGKETVPAILRPMNDEQAMELTIIENLQREDLNPMDQALAFHRLGKEFALTQEQIAAKTGKDRASVANYLRLLKLPDPIRDMVRDGRLSVGHAKAILALESPATFEVATDTVEKGWSVRQTEQEVQRRLTPAEPKPERPLRVVDPNVKEAERELQRSLGLKVQITDRKGKGKIVIEYHSLDDFDRVVEALGGKK